MSSLQAFLSSSAWSSSRSAPPRPRHSSAARVSACLAAEPQKTSPPLDLRRQLSEESKRVFQTEAEVFVRTYARTPVVLQSGRGCKLYDVEGREYLDMAGGIAVNSIGHSDPDWIQALIDQARTLTHVSNIYYTLPQIELGKRLVDCSFADRVFFTNSGTEANEAAIKFARKFQRSSHSGKEAPTEFISYSNCFHGRTMGALSLTSKEQYRKPFEPLMPGVSFLEYGDIEASTKAIKSGRVAAVFVEPIQGEGGIYSATKEFLQVLRSACNEAGALLVFDEVQCGLGRTGFLWAHEAFGVYPDIMTLAKPLAGGLPIGAVLVSEKVAAAIQFGDHGSTFAGGPLVCRAAMAVLNKIQNSEFLENVTKKGLLLKQLLWGKLGKNKHVKEVRGFGLIAGIELDVPAAPLVEECLGSGLLVLTAGKGNVVRLVPPLIISEEEIERAVEILSECLPVLDCGTSE